ncbi:23S rRNA (adenine(2503)-C(2))-methyltransferase RlmN [Clostridium grantii]|uniref:Probable dual-specificity RNA methyltransferase RlmN n=1 Tax=Clostridium grantii DSM 8605 TaxID=1121316 RepID=A0A1M5QTV2_9CLOT|nr:23S rRNA (adenine(2503)-C(2))-methyltransferase RlmN [Clostridium grantii]SHH17398.1 23S rRNA m(2)A-2503 methyltransferase [Clostridium grantii DSM 8605]
MKNILDFNLEELSAWMLENNESKFRAKQIFQWIYKSSVFNYENMKNISEKTRGNISKELSLYLPNIIKEQKSEKDGTKKLLLKLEDGNIIESVIMQYKYGYSICVSTQVGCRMGCSFCASAIGGMVRNLTPGEIIGQILVAQNNINDRISNVVLMGSGEPLDNFDNVIKFIEILNSKESLYIGARHITMSTCGIVPKIYELADLEYQITLAISLHSPKDDSRADMMPIARKYTIKEIIDSCEYYYNKTKRRISFEYALIKGVNDSKEDALSLSKLLNKFPSHVNLISVNEIKENTYKKSDSLSIEMFKNTLIQNGIETTIRRKMGEDIDGACGQLRRNHMENFS